MSSISKYRPLLRPLAWLYGRGVALRNFCFDRGLLPSEAFPIPVICVGNIAVGGTGKTPHVEYILQHLHPQYRVAVLSRGYKRKSKGLVVATESSSPLEIGDEPRQIKLKYPQVRVVVDGNRRRAMRYLMSLPANQRPEVVVMDDGYQHRYIKPSYSILLVDARRPVWDDRLLPEGNLRESISALYRADCIIVTKCPEDMSPIQQRIIERNLALFPHQQIYFTRMAYEALQPLVPPDDSVAEVAPPGRVDRVIALAGIANPEPFVQRLKSRFRLVDSAIYPDHHHFDLEDVKQMNQRYTQLLAEDNSSLYMICTEKDAVRLVEYQASLSPELLNHIYYLPIQVQVLHNEEEFKRSIWLAARAKPASLQI
ncbi:MAG: tetraacyldisaccharide 4'-kinase [Porphyromonadaceae bacterium]|nr:tetraacyldisaccharide 4'-kinase [Porphyromonadaceae bacterium]